MNVQALPETLSPARRFMKTLLVFGVVGPPKIGVAR